LELNDILKYAIRTLNVIIVLGALKYLASKMNELKFISAYFVIAFLFQTAQTLIGLKGFHNIFLYHWFTPIEFVVLSINYFTWEREYSKLYIPIITGGAVAIALFCYHTYPKDIFNSSPNDIPIVAITLTCIFLLIFTIRASIVGAKNYRLFFIYGMMLYYSQNAPLLYMYQAENFLVPLVYHKVLVVICYSLYIAGYFYAFYRRK